MGSFVCNLSLFSLFLAVPLGLWDLVPRPGIYLDPLHWERGVLPSGPPGSPLGIIIKTQHPEVERDCLDKFLLFKSKETSPRSLQVEPLTCLSAITGLDGQDLPLS